MRHKRLFVMFIFTFLLVNGISESGTSTVSACTNFKIKNDQTVFFGNSEDKTYTPISETYITFIPKGQVWYDGSTIEYGSVVVGYANGSEYSWVQGGMNDQGLAFDSTGVPYTTPNLHNERPPLLIPQLFTCANISEVIETTSSHSIYSVEGSVQTFYVDKSGESVVYHIGEEGELATYHSNDSFQLATNYYVDNSSRGNPSPDSIERYNDAEEKLNEIVDSDVLTIDSIASVLEVVHFEGGNLNTVYSNIFDVTNGEIYLFYFHQFEEVVQLNLEEELAKGRHSYRIADLFTQTTVDDAEAEYNAYPFLVRTFYADLILLIGTGVIDILIILGLMFIVCRKILYKLLNRKKSHKLHFQDREEKQTINDDIIHDPPEGLKFYIFLSLALIWSFLSFPMIKWNRQGEKFSLEPLPFPSFYENYHFFLIAGVISVFLLTYLLYSFTNKGEIFHLGKRGVVLGKTAKWSHLAFLTLPGLIELSYICLAFFDIVPKVDWLILIITYPLMLAILILIAPIIEKKKQSKKEFSRANWFRSAFTTNLYLILVWGFWFLPLFLTVKLNNTYVLLLLSFAITAFSFTLYWINRFQNFERNESKFMIET